MAGPVTSRPTQHRSRRLRRAAILVALAVSATACGGEDDASDADEPTGVGTIEYRDEPGPHVEVPERSMSMTVDAVDVDGDDVLVRLRVENHRDAYLDLGVQGTIYGPLLVMIDDRGQRYEGYAEEPAGIPGRRLADLSFRLEGPIDRGAESFTLELATQRGTVTSPSAALPDGDGVRWRVDDPVAGAPASAGSDPSEPGFAAAPRLPELIHFWLHTEPLSAAG